MVQQDPAERARTWGLFDPGNPGSYPGRVERVFPGDVDKTILDLRATDDRGVSLITVVLSAKSGGKVATLRTPFCHLSWGVSGGRDEAIVDWLHGQAVTVPATFLRVSATFPLNNNVNPPGFPPGTLDGETFGTPTSGSGGDPLEAEAESLFLGVNVAPLSHSGAAFGWTPRLTTFHVIPAAGDSDFIPVPSHAQSITLLGNIEPGDVSNIAAFTIATPGAALYSVPNPTPNLDQFAFPIARGAEFIQLESAVPNDLLVLLLWTIGL